jgi:hypothetical protein
VDIVKGTTISSNTPKKPKKDGTKDTKFTKYFGHQTVLFWVFLL